MARPLPPPRGARVAREDGGGGGSGGGSEGGSQPSYSDNTSVSGGSDGEEGASTSGGSGSGEEEEDDDDVSSMAEDSGSGSDASGARRARKAPLARSRRAMSTVVARLLAHLSEALEAKARGYKHDGLGRLFLMNNVHYMVWSVEQSAPLASLLGRDWLESHRDTVEAHGAAVHELCWMPLARLLEPTSDKARARERLKQFTAGLEAAYGTQCQWAIADRELRAAVRGVILQDVLPPYKAFVQAAARLEPGGKGPRYPPDALQRMVGDLFEGQPGKIAEYAGGGGH